LAVDVLPARSGALAKVRTEGTNSEGKCSRSGVKQPTQLVSEYQRRVIVDHLFRARMLGQRIIAGADDNNDAEPAGEVVDSGGEYSGSWRAVRPPRVAEREVDDPGPSIRGVAQRIKESRFPEQIIGE
jgi:hypothetical protein